MSNLVHHLIDFDFTNGNLWHVESLVDFCRSMRFGRCFDGFELYGRLFSATGTFKHGSACEENPSIVSDYF